MTTTATVFNDLTLDSNNSQAVGVLPKILVPGAQPRPKGAIAYNTGDDSIWYSDGIQWLPFYRGRSVAYTSLVVASASYTLDADADVIFATNVVTHNLTITDLTSITIVYPGIYEFSYSLQGYANTNDGSYPLQFAIYVNGAVPDPAYIVRSELAVNPPDSDQIILVGSGFLDLAAGDVVTLHNLTTSGEEPPEFGFVSVTPTGGQVGVNASLTLKKLG